jgi:hypothetical protein
LKWEGCGQNPQWRNGSYTIEERHGELWPLEPGKKARYEVTAASGTGETSDETRECEVANPVRIKVAIGEVDAAKVVCTTHHEGTVYRIETWYWTPDHGEVKYTRKHSDGDIVADDETLRTSRAAGY